MARATCTGRARLPSRGSEPREALHLRFLTFLA